MAEDSPEIRLKGLARQWGALAVGIASVDAVAKCVPEGHRPDDLLPRARSVVVVGIHRYTAGLWHVGSVEAVHRAYTVGYEERRIAHEMAHYIERDYGHEAIYYGANIRDTGWNPPLSLKVCAELAGLGTRSMAGGLILHPTLGLLFYGAVITTMPLEADGPLARPVCPHPSCIAEWERKGTTPCKEICSAIDGKLENGRLQDIVYYRALCATRALTTMNATYLRLLPEIISEEDPEKRKFLAIGQARQYAEDPPGRGLWGRCYECMRVCPVNRAAYARVTRRRK